MTTWPCPCTTSTWSAPCHRHPSSSSSSSVEPSYGEPWRRERRDGPRLKPDLRCNCNCGWATDLHHRFCSFEWTFDIKCLWYLTFRANRQIKWNDFVPRVKTKCESEMIYLIGLTVSRIKFYNCIIGKNSRVFLYFQFGWGRSLRNSSFLILFTMLRSWTTKSKQADVFYAETEVFRLTRNHELIRLLPTENCVTRNCKSFLPVDSARPSRGPLIVFEWNRSGGCLRVLRSIAPCWYHPTFRRIPSLLQLS